MSIILNSKNKPALRTILIALIFFIALIGWTVWQFHFNYMIASNDTIFHSERIYEIRLAFKNHVLPSWVNFNTFFYTGQAINGMYPDFTLWPFVFITNFLTAIHQIIAIKFLIAAMTFIVSFLSLNKRFDSQNAVLAATIFALSGSALKDLTTEMQTGSAIVMIFAFPILFTLKDAIESKEIDPRLIIKTALLMTIVINSHLLSAVAITMIAGIFLIIVSIVKRTFVPWINLGIAALLTVILCLPIIYRIITISKTGLLSPFGKGHVLSDPIWTLFLNSRWNSKSAVSNASLILLIVTLLGFKKKKLNELLPWLAIEIVLIIFCTNIIPWNLLSHIPIINTFQVANWRFGLFLGMIPLILVLINFNKKTASIILLTLAVLSYPMSLKTAVYSQFHKAADLPIVTQYTTQQIPQNTAAKLTSTGINSDKLMRSLVPDYAPQTTPLQKDSGGLNLDQQVVYLLSNHIGQTNDRDINFKHRSTIDSTILTGNNVPKGTLSLPVFGYKSLHYQVTVNNKPVAWDINNHGFITLTNKKALTKANIEVRQLQPQIYPALIWMAFVLYLALIGVLIAPTIKRLRA